MLHWLCGSPSIPLSFSLAAVLPRRLASRVSLRDSSHSFLKIGIRISHQCNAKRLRLTWLENQTNLLRIHSKPVIGIGFTKDSRYLISGDFDNLIKYSDIKDNTLLHEQNIEGEFNLLQIIPSTDVIKTEMIITSDKSKAYKYILPEFKEGNITR